MGGFVEERKLKAFLKVSALSPIHPLSLSLTGRYTMVLKQLSETPSMPRLPGAALESPDFIPLDDTRGAVTDQHLWCTHSLVGQSSCFL